MARLSLALSLTLAALALPASADAATRYAHVLASKSSGPCPSNTPCHVEWAIEGAVAGDEVVIAPGTYNLESGIITTRAITIHGVADEARPRLVLPAGEQAQTLLVSADTGTPSIRHLQIENSSPGFGALAIGGRANLSGLVVVSRGETGYGLFLGTSGNVVARDSVFRATRKLGSAVMNYGGDLTLRNATVIAQGEDSVGLRSQGLCQPAPCGVAHAANTTAVNTIARGLAEDVYAASSFTEAPAKTQLSYSNWRPDESSGAGDGGSIADLGNNQSAAPIFRNATFGDFHQLSGSPTVDAGLASLGNGAFDIDGEARVHGAAPDIGADEFHPSSRPGGGGGGGGSGGGEPGEGETGEGEHGTGPVSTDTTAPVAGNVGVKPAKLRAAKKGLSIAAKRGAKVTYALSEPATMTFAVERGSAGRKVGGSCVKPSKSNAKAKRCTRWKLLKGVFQHNGAAGPNSFRFTGRLDGRALSPGRYRLAAIPNDAAGNVGKPALAAFEIVR